VENEKVVNILNVFMRAIQSYGIERVQSTIESLENQQMDDSERLLLDYIVTKCMEYYDVEPKEMFNTSVRKCYYARSMSFILLNAHTRLTQEQIGGLFGGSRVSVSRAIKMFNRESRGVSSTDALKFIKSHDVLNKKVVEFKKKLMF
jgi:chromosomal replication initiation ATPase DnaA